MLTELSVVEQRYLAVREVLDGAKITDVATRYSVDRRTIYRWVTRYATEGIGALADRSSRPDRCPHQIAPEVEARIAALRTATALALACTSRSCVLHGLRLLSYKTVERVVRQMPMIDVYATEGTFTDKRALAQDLAQAVMRWEQVPRKASTASSSSLAISETRDLEIRSIPS
jgi:hypothetical protein